MPGERVADALGLHGAAAERHHLGVVALEQLADDLLLARPEGLLALAVEERLDRLADALLHLAVRVERLRAQLGGERPGAGRLAGTHEAHQDDRPAAGYLALHPMRSS